MKLKSSEVPSINTLFNNKTPNIGRYCKVGDSVEYRGVSCYTYKAFSELFAMYEEENLILPRVLYLDVENGHPLQLTREHMFRISNNASGTRKVEASVILVWCYLVKFGIDPIEANHLSNADELVEQVITDVGRIRLCCAVCDLLYRPSYVGDPAIQDYGKFFRQYDKLFYDVGKFFLQRMEHWVDNHVELGISDQEFWRIRSRLRSAKRYLIPKEGAKCNDE